MTGTSGRLAGLRKNSETPRQSVRARVDLHLERRDGAFEAKMADVLCVCREVAPASHRIRQAYGIPIFDGVHQPTPDLLVPAPLG